MKRFLQVTLFLFGTILFTGCEFEDPDFSNVGNFKTTGLTGQVLNFTMDVTCDNPNGLGFKVKRGLIDVTVNDLNMGVLKLSKKVKIKRRSINTYTVPLTLELANGALFRLPQIVSKKEVKVSFVGKVRGSVFGISRSFDVNETMTVDGKLLSSFGIGGK